MKFVILFFAFSVSVAQAEVLTCKAKRIANYGEQDFVSDCLLTLDSNDKSQMTGPSSIFKDKFMGTAKTNCEIPGPAAYGLWDQGAIHLYEVEEILEVLGKEYGHYGKLGFKLEDVVSAHWYAGGSELEITLLYVFTGKDGKTVGAILYPLVHAQEEKVQGCFVE
ncbi:MAG: hypothetical protein ABL958_05300 [Bdellovibrionia bacterium]